MDMEQTVKKGRISRCSILRKDISEIRKLVREYNEELRAWENQTEQKEEKQSEPPKKGKHTGKITPLSAGKQATAKTNYKEKIYGQRTMRKVEKKMKKTIF